MNYYLLKTEPQVYSIDDLKREKQCFWEGIRSYAARKNLLSMQKGDKLIIYHSMTKPAGAAGTAEVVKTAYPDFTAWDKKSDYYDPKTDKQNPRWYMVDVKYGSTFSHFVTIDELKKESKLKDMVLFRESRLSVQALTKKQFETICQIGSL